LKYASVFFYFNIFQATNDNSAQKFCIKLLAKIILINKIFKIYDLLPFPFYRRNHCGRDPMVVGFTTTYTISTYHHLGCEFEYRSYNRTLCDKVCQWLAAGQWFLLALRFPPLINWNIVESGVKPHNLTFYRIHIIYFSVNTVYSHPSIMLWCSVFSILLFLSQRLSTIDIYLHPSHLLTFPISIKTVVKKGYGCKQTWDPTLL
jgi:hypothetical protein